MCRPHASPHHTAYFATFIHGVQALLERYFELLPQVCGCEAEDLQWKRMLFAGQPCYRSAPTQPQFDRVLQVGCMEGRCGSWPACHSSQDDDVSERCVAVNARAGSVHIL